MIGLAFTPEQFKTLLRMVYISNTIVNGHRDETFVTEYDDLEQYIFSRAESAGFPAATTRHATTDGAHHHPSRLFEHDPEVNSLMDEYDARMMIELLSEKLAERDIEQLHGPDAKTKMPDVDYVTLLDAISGNYEKEFEEHGLLHLGVSLSPRAN
jgi:hypothetical protein